MTGDIRSLTTGTSCNRCGFPAWHMTDTGELLCAVHALLATLDGENIVTVSYDDPAEEYAPLSTLDQMCPEMYPDGESTSHRIETKDPQMAPKLPTPEECRSIYAEAVGMYTMRCVPELFDHGDAERVGFRAVLKLVEARIGHPVSGVNYFAQANAPMSMGFDSFDDPPPMPSRDDIDDELLGPGDPRYQ